MPARPAPGSFSAPKWPSYLPISTLKSTLEAANSPAHRASEVICVPLVRGRVLAEVELSGRKKQFLDILIWSELLDSGAMAALGHLDHLRIYLSSLDPFVCQIRLWVPRRHFETSKALAALKIEHRTVPEREPSREVAGHMKNAEGELLIAIQTALSIDADCLAITNLRWLPFLENTNTNLGLLLTDCSFLLPYSEIFTRGHDVPWAFEHMVWYEPWNAFYQMSESLTLKPGMDVLQKAQQKNAPEEARETGRSLVHNRLPNLCFTRDRLLFYEIQRLVSKRSGWKRQQFAFEIAYYLNFYYLLIYGTFDHAALFVSQLLGLGLPEKQVGATYRLFLEALQKKSPELHALFIDDSIKKFIDRIAHLRNYAAHRGTLMPSIVVNAPDREPTNDELDEDIRNAGLDFILNAFPPGRTRDEYHQMLRQNARMARYEKGKILEGVVMIEMPDKKVGLINPLMDTSWNFSRTLAFLDSVFEECMRILG